MSYPENGGPQGPQWNGQPTGGDQGWGAQDSAPQAGSAEGSAYGEQSAHGAVGQDNPYISSYGELQANAYGQNSSAAYGQQPYGEQAYAQQPYGQQPGYAQQGYPQHGGQQPGFGQPQYGYAPQGGFPGGAVSAEDHSGAYIVHFLGVLSVLGSGIGWLVFKDRGPASDREGKEAFNFCLTTFIFEIACMFLSNVIGGVMAFIDFGITAMLFAFAGFCVTVASIVFSIIGGVRTKERGSYRYPVNFRFIK